MLGKIPICINVENGKTEYLDLDRAIAERISIQANSGGGKSWAIRDICEQSHGRIQQILISPKNEFATLREKYDDYILIGKSTANLKVDIEINMRYVEQLAIKILETGANAIICLDQIPKERVHFVKLFIETLNNAPDNLWHPVLVIVDEIHLFSPEKGHGEAESLGAIIDLASRGRDSGYCLVGATQKLSKFNKDVASELNIKFIGRCSLDNDMKRAGAELGLLQKDLPILRTLGHPNYHFFAFGSGFSDNVIKIKFLPVQTPHITGWQRVKGKTIIADSKKLKSLVDKFSDLPVIAEKEIKTKEDFIKTIHELNVKIVELQKIKPILQVSEQNEEKIFMDGYKKGVSINLSYMDEWKKYNESLIKDLHSLIEEIYKDAIGIKNAISIETSNSITNMATNISNKLKTTLAKHIKPIPVFEGNMKKFDVVKDIIKTKPIINIDLDEFVDIVKTENKRVSSGALRMLKASKIFLGKTISKNQMCLFAKLSPSSGTTSNYISELRTRNLIEDVDGGFQITESGLELAGDVETLPNTNDGLLDLWCEQLGGKGKDILRLLARHYPDYISREYIRESVGLTNSGTFSNYLSDLRGNGLMEENKSGCKASSELFPYRNSTFTR